MDGLRFTRSEVLKTKPISIKEIISRCNDTIPKARNRSRFLVSPGALSFFGHIEVVPVTLENIKRFQFLDELSDDHIPPRLSIRTILLPV